MPYHVQRCSPLGAPRLDGGAEAGFVAGMKYHVTLIEEEEGGWSVICNALPGCCSQGETRKEAIENIRIAIREYLEVVEEDLRKDLRKENNGLAVIREAVLV